MSEQFKDATLIQQRKLTNLELLLASSQNEIFKSEDGYIRGYQFESQFIGKVITPNRLKVLTNNMPIFIAAQTGSGKSSLVLGQVLPQVRSTGRRLLILASRTVLAEQYKRDIAGLEKPDLLEDLTPTGLRRQKEFGDVTILTYQEFFFLLEKNPSKTFHEYGAVVLDECHFFIQDAAFNEYTQALLKSIIKRFHHCLRFYLSATPDICLDEIIELERKQQSRFTRFENYWNNEGFNNVALKPSNIFNLYYFTNDYGYIDPCFFKEDSDIVDIIKNDTSSYKYLICVDNKEQGQFFQRTLGSDICEYIDAELKNSTKEEVVTAMVRDKKFDKKVLIATSFLDVGINLIDCNLTNIVIYSTDKTHFIQSIGRKRKSPQEKVTLYIHIPELQYVKNLLRGAQMTYMETAKNKNEYLNTQQNIIPSLSFPFFLSIHDGMPVINYNGFTFTYWKNRIKELKTMLSNIIENQNYEEAFAKHYLRWLELEESYNKCHWLGKSPDALNEEMIRFLDSYANQDLTEDAFGTFKEAFLIEYNRIYPETPLRKDRKLHLNALGKCFNEKKLPYHVKNIGSRSKTYRIEKG